jgi:hypothetical protein
MSCLAQARSTRSGSAPIVACRAGSNHMRGHLSDGDRLGTDASWSWETGSVPMALPSRVPGLMTHLVL